MKNRVVEMLRIECRVDRGMSFEHGSCTLCGYATDNGLFDAGLHVRRLSTS